MTHNAVRRLLGRVGVRRGWGRLLVRDAFVHAEYLHVLDPQSLTLYRRQRSSRQAAGPSCEDQGNQGNSVEFRHLVIDAAGA
jgi:hypothetical protein